MASSKSLLTVVSIVLVTSACTPVLLKQDPLRQEKLASALEVKKSCVRYQSEHGMIAETASWTIAECWRIAKAVSGLK